MNSPWINLTLALPAEARPLIRHYELQRLQPEGPCPLYLGEGMALALTGVGAEAMASGIDHLSRHLPHRDVRWLNLGIAGHGSLQPGSCLLVERVIDSHTGRHWEMHAPAGSGLPLGPLECVAEPVSTYAADRGYDMESGGYAAALCALDALERSSILKVVSDGPNHPCERISAGMVSDLIHKALPVITSLIARLHHNA